MSSNLQDIQGIILAGGLGTRLRSVVSDRPKPLAIVNGRPFLSHVLDQLVKGGIRRIVLCTHYLSEQIESYYGNRYHGAILTYSREPYPLGTAGALRNAFSVLTSETLLVMNGDSFCDYSLDALIDAYTIQKVEALILVTTVEDCSRYGRIQTNSQGRITSFVEKSNAKGPGLINAGVYLLRKDLLASVPEKTSFSLEKDLFPALGIGSLGTFLSKGPFIDIGTPESYALASTVLAPPASGRSIASAIH